MPRCRAEPAARLARAGLRGPRFSARPARRRRLGDLRLRGSEHRSRYAECSCRRSRSHHRARGSRMIDIHTHLLPGVDDGARTIGESLPVLERFVGEGVETVVCTPHLAASRVADAPYTRHAEVFAELMAAAPSGPRL